MIILTALLAAHAADVEIRVLERGSGSPIAEAEVLRESAVLGVSDARGTVTVSVEPGDALVVRSALHATVELAMDAPADIRVYLEPAPELEVVVESFRTSPHVTRHAMDAEMALETPGALDDSVRLVQSLPGVTVQREYSPGQGSLSVRGSAPGDNRYYLDGVEVPYLYHYNQYASVFPTSQLGQLELFPSTFGAGYGNATGAIVEAESTRDAPKTVHGGASLNYVMAGGDVRAPLGKDWWAAAAGRRSYFDAAGERSDQYPVFPRFHDFLLRVEHGDSDDGTGIAVWGAGDAYTRAAGELDVLDPVEREQTPRLDFARRFQVLSAQHRWVGANADGRVVAAAVHHRRASELAGTGSEALDEWTFSSRLDVRGTASTAVSWEAGYEVQQGVTGLEVVSEGYDGLLVAEEAPALARGVSVDDRLIRTLGGAYGSLQLVAGPVRVMPGLRAGLDTTSSDVLLEPRLATRVRLADQTAVKVAGGRYLQRPDSETLIPGTGDPSLPTSGAWQVSVGLEQTIAGRLELGLDGYRKWLTSPLIFPVDAPALARPIGDAWGVEAITRYRIREVFFLWGWLAVSGATVETPAGRTDPADGDQRVSGGVVASWDVGRWTLGARFRYATGLPYTPVLGSLYDGTRDAWVPLTGADNSARLPTYTKVDLRVAHTWVFDRWSLALSSEVWFVPPSATQLYPAWSYDWSEEQFVRGPTLLPLLGVRARF
ncbi:MAG: hypothetical protein ACI8PZ_001125 [Myxococcota bacterium]